MTHTLIVILASVACLMMCIAGPFILGDAADQRDVLWAQRRAAVVAEQKKTLIDKTVVTPEYISRLIIRKRDTK